MQGKSGFFKEGLRQIAKKETNCSYLSLGGDQFYAVAVAFIDELKSSNQLTEAATKLILDRFFVLYPQHKAPQRYLTPKERLNLLVNSPRKSEIIHCMADVLRQITMDELFINPLKYKEVFDEFKNDSLKSVFRHTSTPLHVNALKALSRSLDITLSLTFKEPEKELGKQQIFRQSISNPGLFKLRLLVQLGHYFPGVKHSDYFINLGLTERFIPKPSAEPPVIGENIAGIKDMIDTDNKRLLNNFSAVCKKIMSFVAAGEISLNQLIDMYIQFYPVDGENEARFFTQKEEPEKKPISVHKVDLKELKTLLLVRSLSAWICTNKMDSKDADEFFRLIEEGPIRHRTLSN